MEGTMNENGTVDWIEAARMYRAMAEELQGIPGSEKMLEDAGRAVVEGARAAFDAKLSSNVATTQGAWPFRKVQGRPKLADPRVEKDLQILGVEPSEAVAVAGTDPKMDPRTARILRDAEGPKRLCRKSGRKGPLMHISDAPAGWISVRKAVADVLRGWGAVDKQTLTNLLKQSSRRATAIGLAELGDPWVGDPVNGRPVPKFFASMGTDEGSCYCYPPGKPAAILRRAVSEKLGAVLMTAAQAAEHLGVTPQTVRSHADKGKLEAVKDDKGQWRISRRSVLKATPIAGPMAELLKEARTVRNTGGLTGLAAHAVQTGKRATP
jgi:excisionase family DNA binding protein